jgi:hypothetical protein
VSSKGSPQATPENSSSEEEEEEEESDGGRAPPERWTPRLYLHLSCLELQHKHDLDSLDRLSLAFSCYLLSRLD